MSDHRVAPHIDAYFNAESLPHSGFHGGCTSPTMILERRARRFAALYELDDEQLRSALDKLGKNARIVLANGSVKNKGGRPERSGA